MASRHKSYGKKARTKKRVKLSRAVFERRYAALAKKRSSLGTTAHKILLQRDLLDARLKKIRVLQGQVRDAMAKLESSFEGLPRRSFIP